MDPRKDYYAVLGVLPSIDGAVIQAIYRILAKKYHPDTGTGPEAGNEQFAKLSEAYEVLGDPERRAEYDRLRAARKEQTNPFDDPQGDSAAPPEDDEAWEIVRKYEPATAEIEKKLTRLSRQTALNFRAHMLKQKAFHSAAEVGEKLEELFFSTHFGADRTIREFARRLFIPGRWAPRRTAAWELSKIVHTLGTPTNPRLVIDGLSEQFGLVNFGHPPPTPIPNSGEGWQYVLAASSTQGWKHHGIYAEKFTHERTGEVVSPKKPEEAWMMMRLDDVQS